MSDDFTLLPAWKNAAANLFGGRYGYGDIVPHDELLAAFLLPKPRGLVKPADYERWRLDVLAQQSALADYLLQERNMLLVSVPGKGYRICPPQEQTEHASVSGMARVRREVGKMLRQLVYVDRGALSDEQSKANADALARAGWLRQQVGRVKRLRLGDDGPKKIEG